MGDDQVSKTVVSGNSGGYHFSTIVVIAVVVSCLVAMSLCFIGLCACLNRKKAKKKASAVKKNSALISKSSTDSWLTGVIAEQPIQFVVPMASMSLCETTEDSLSEPDTLLRIDERNRKRSSVSFFMNPEAIQKGLYKEEQTTPKKRSLLAGLGRIGFSLHYNVLRQQLCVRLIGAAQLPSSFAKDTANPFAKVTLLPDKTARFMSKVHRHTVNPVFNEVFVFPIKKETLSDKEIKISVYDQDKFNRKVLIGCIRFPVKDAGIQSDIFEDANSGDIWTDLRLEVGEDKPGAGDLLFSLCYKPETTTLTVIILKARNVSTEEKINMLYVKVSLYVRKRLVRTRKTMTKRHQQTEVEFNDPFNIILPPGAIADVDLIITLCGKASGRGGSSKRVLGRTQVGSDSPKEHGIHHWQDMLASTKSTAAQWHPLAE